MKMTAGVRTSRLGAYIRYVSTLGVSSQGHIRRKRKKLRRIFRVRQGARTARLGAYIRYVSTADASGNAV